MYVYINCLNFILNKLERSHLLSFIFLKLYCSDCSLYTVFLRIRQIPIATKATKIKQYDMSKIYTYEEIAEHNTTESSWIVIEGKVYNVTKFLDEHPGGDEIIFDLAGTDATENFEDIGHSDQALKVLKTLYIGDVDKNSKPIAVKKTVNDHAESGEPWQGNANIVMVLAAIFFYVAYQWGNK
ncbi:hypothetical protein TPHA_0F01790 [Tetrapisispora phaffii CBS 4417]|uniref:Cytochrome b5 heme-binding domain-containing protein n=1 Tax=Tetrapisispora phaffii (strain ATCC 24235 / CBS 4417 / NBRC 1672 / NRRL Y-8282 / UCD 70-5) TaxID=1071381 RepID=G8BV81_TETPH|nr:hypothetical protein TPHA_0F01790 [Tetrapisispora phaffii CBS 4417]CCE63663.1 hypothetical protein TPHA_0F01790 [Tetrapisispora phaffii CBS 4417]